MASALLNVKIITPKADLFNGEARSVSSTNSAGRFDILPEHANFITSIENFPITIQKADGSKVVFRFPQAIIYTTNNQVSIYTDIHLQAEELEQSQPTSKSAA